MKTCAKCGTENPDSAVNCTNCGEQLETQGMDMTAVKEMVSDVAGKTISGAKNLVGQLNDAVNTTLENQKTKSNNEIQQAIEQAQNVGTVKTHTASASGTEYMSSSELWSWLRKDSKRQHFYTEEENSLSQKEYTDQLSKKLADNGVSASVQYRDIQWDRSSVKQTACFVQPQSDAVNPLSCLILFNHVGKYTFVEEKTFITPPELPEVPMKPVKLDDELSKRAAWILWGGLVALAGLFLIMFTVSIGLLIIAAGCGMAWLGYGAKQKIDALQAHNQKCAEQERAWADAWNNWEDSIFMHSFQENINGQISRIYDAVFECIKQLNAELFSEKASVEQQESQSMNELEQLIARRKDDYR